ncbi:MAG: hypothetical protein JNK82_23105 [Myxococcaceae bacterium]|nr:hypothetical protein [Myxococcaceae bacterium]
MRRRLRRRSALLNDELGSARENAAERLSRRLDARHPLGEARKLPRPELRLLDVEPHHLLLHVRGRLVPRATVMSEVSGNQQPASAEPLSPQALNRAAQAVKSPPNAALVSVELLCKAKQHSDDGDTHRLMRSKEQSHARILLRRLRELAPQPNAPNRLALPPNLMTVAGRQNPQISGPSTPSTGWCPSPRPSCPGLR